MSIEIEFSGDLARVVTDLATLNEHVGFFLADWHSDTRRFVVRDARRLAPEEYETLTDFHVALVDHVRPSLIHWAWTEGASLIELHSHGPRGVARFSPTDLDGFEEWVPHLWWRLRARPYAALVATGVDLDGLAWISSPTEPERIVRVVLGNETVETSQATHASVRRQRVDRSLQP
jgi:hypothetical protein